MKRRILALIGAVALGAFGGCGRTAPSKPAPQDSSAAASLQAAPPPSSEALSQQNASGEQSAQLADFDQPAFERYFADFARFFHQPAETPAALPLDYLMGYFLVYQSWLLGTAAGQSYEQNAALLYLIPEQELSATAEILLGIDDFDPALVAQWPFGANPPEGFQLYSTESSLPYLEITAQTVSCQGQTVTVRAALETGMGDEGETPPSVLLVYEFRRMAGQNAGDGGELYQLVSIDEG